ncbi:hypothetical protein F4779DRAFT_254585 [Xylariaceae sp. FL0662B]|nr:hypothetical protein F4779DRAFT_254585 [Xylariaceae sp. FL0662B]
MRIMKVPKVNLAFFKKLWPRKLNATNSTIPESQVAAAAAEEHSHKKQKASFPPPQPPEECPICHDPVGIANPEGVVESWTKLHCGHKFGTHCIQAWLEESVARDQNTTPSCPICRVPAKHPCGHLVSPPPFPSIHHHQYHHQYQYQYHHHHYHDEYDDHYLQAWRPSPSPPPPLPRRRIRRRLTRRPGHPLRPPPAPRRAVQTVGECRTCAENAEFDLHMRRRMAEQHSRSSRRRHNTGDAGAGTGLGSGLAGRRSAAIKSLIIPGLKRSTNNVRTTIVNMGLVDDEQQRLQQARGGGGGGGLFCAVGPSGHAMPRSPTPTPGHGRRLSI